MYNYKIYYQFSKYGEICLSNMEYSSKVKSDKFQFFRELEECIALTEGITKNPRGYEITIYGIYLVEDKVVNKTVNNGKKNKLQEV